MQRRAVFLAVGGLMLTTAAMASLKRLVPMRAGAFDLDREIPQAFGGWTIDPSVVPIAPSPDVQANLDKIYDQIISRTYVNQSGQRVMLVIAYGGEQSDSLKAHRQEVCYAAQGFAIRSVKNDKTRIAGADVPVVRVHAVKGRRSEPLSYWFTMGDRVVMGRSERLVAQIGYGLQGQVPDGLLVRVSSLSNDLPGSYATHDEFLQALMAAVGPEAKTRLAGLPRAES